MTIQAIKKVLYGNILGSVKYCETPYLKHKIVIYKCLNQKILTAITGIFMHKENVHQRPKSLNSKSDLNRKFHWTGDSDYSD